VPANYDAITYTATTSGTTALVNASLVPLAPILAVAGFYPASPLPQPANTTQTAWALLTNVTGLVAGTTRVGDELSLLYNAQTIVNSTLASITDWVWDGSAFVAP
jgi:hypothetical protein